MTDCCTTPPSIGTWKISVKKPIFYPSRVFFDWNDGTGIQQIYGDNYIVTEEYYSDSNNYYHVTIRKEIWRRQNTNSAWYFAYSFNETYYNLRGKILGLGSYDPSNWDAGYGVLYNNGNSLYQSCPNYELVSSNYPYSVNALKIFIVNITRNDGNVQKQYTLKIFSNGLKVFESYKNVQPTVNIIPEQCLQSEQKEYVRDYQNYKSGDYCQQIIQGNQTTLLLFSEQINGTYVPVVLASVSSDERCSLAPIYDVECVSCKTCPDGSCSVTCGDKICCYDIETGIAIDSFLISEMCI